MINSIRNWWKSLKKDSPEVCNYNGLRLYRLDSYFCDKNAFPGPYDLLEAFKRNLKANGITLYCDQETFSKFVNNVMLTDDFEIFLDSLYLTAYENPDKYLVIIPGEEFEIGVIVI